MTVIRDRSQPTYVGAYPSMTVGKTYYYVDMGALNNISPGGSYPFPTYDAALQFRKGQEALDAAGGYPTRLYEINEYVHTPTASKEKH